MAISFFSSKDIEEERVMYTKSDNKEFMNYDNANNIADELFNTLQDTKIIQKREWKGVNLFQIQLMSQNKFQMWWFMY